MFSRSHFVFDLKYKEIPREHRKFKEEIYHGKKRRISRRSHAGQYE